MEFIAFLLINVLRILKWALLLRVLMSWVQVNPYGRLTRLVHEITEPLLSPIRGFMPRGGMIDFSPLIGFIGLDVAQWGLMHFLNRIG